MASDLKNALRSTRDMDDYLEVHSAQEIIDDINEVNEVALREALRDQFAMAALQGHLAYSHYNESWGDYHNNGSHDGLAGRCYDLADAMLKARLLTPPTRSDAAE